MNGSFCEATLQYLPTYSDFKELRSTYIANCVFINFLTHTAIMWNIITIYAIRKASSLPKTLRTHMLSLAVSDVGVGLFAQPFYTSLLVRLLQQNHLGCNYYLVLNVCGYFFSFGSFLGVVAVSVDRFLAVHLHLRYQELVTFKRVVVEVMAIWTVSTFLSFFILWGTISLRDFIVSATAAIGFTLMFVVYIRMYLIIRRHKNQIRSMLVQDVPQAAEMTNFAGLIKSTVGVFYVCLVFLACYLPYLICIAVIKINGTSTTLKKFHLFALTVVFLNSSLNPVIYCWKMRHIQHAIMEILRSMSWRRRQPSRLHYDRSLSFVHVDN